MNKVKIPMDINSILRKELTPLQLCKKLKDLGFEQDSLCYYLPKNKNNYEPYIAVKGLFNEHYHSDMISDFTVNELGKLLPKKLNVENQTYFFNQTISKHGNWHISYRNELGHLDFYFSSLHESIVRAETIIYLKEEGLI